MTTVVWVILCVLGLLTGYALGWSRRQRQAAATTPASEPRPAPTAIAEDADAPVIDLRVVAEDATPPPVAPRSEPRHADRPVAGASKPPADSPRLSLATRGGTTVANGSAGSGRPDAEVIDLATAKPVPLHNLQFLDRVGPRMDKRLRANGIVTVPELATARRKDLRRILADDADRAEDLVDLVREEARSMVDAAAHGRVATADPGTELRRVQGIGTTMMRWLETQGITALAQLSALTKTDVDRLEAALTDYPGRIRTEKWRGQARRLLG